VKQRIANSGDPAKDWRDMGPCAPIGCGPLGEHHSKGWQRDASRRDDEPALAGHIFPVVGERPMQLPILGGDISTL